MEPVALIVMLLLLATGGGGNGDQKPQKPQKPKPKPKHLTPSKPKPKEPIDPNKPADPLPDPVPKPADLPADPGDTPPGANELAITPDCKDAVVGKGWMVAVAIPRLNDLAQAGIGLPVYTELQADRSLDAAVRTVLSESAGGAACIDQIPWLDRYVKQNPVPMPAEDETILEYFNRLQMWDDAWDLKLKQWVQGHPKLAAKVLGPLYTAGALSFVGANNIDINFGQNGPLTGGMTSADGDKLRGLGYDMFPGVVETFQIQYNMVRDYQMNGGWTQMGWRIDEDDDMGPATRHAMAEAAAMTGPNRSWPAIVFSALTG